MSVDAGRACALGRKAGALPAEGLSDSGPLARLRVARYANLVTNNALYATAVLCLILAVAAAVLSAKLRAARAALTEAERKLAVPPPPPPPVTVECRREAFGILWFPVLTIDERRRLVTAASVGLPHCPRCVKPMSLKPGPAGEWVCPACGEVRAGSAADIRVTDSVLGEALQEFLSRRGGGYALAEGIRAPKSAKA